MKTDVEIAQEAEMQDIRKIAEKLEISEDELELYGKYKAKVTLDAWDTVKDRPNGKLVLVTAINPTPAGEGKTTTSVGLADAFHKQGKKVARSGWNGKGMWLLLQLPDEHSKMGLPYIYLKTVDGEFVPWLASQQDIFSEKWDVLPNVGDD